MQEGADDQRKHLHPATPTRHTAPLFHDWNHFLCPTYQITSSVSSCPQPVTPPATSPQSPAHPCISHPTHFTSRALCAGRGRNNGSGEGFLVPHSPAGPSAFSLFLSLPVKEHPLTLTGCASRLLRLHQEAVPRAQGSISGAMRLSTSDLRAELRSHTQQQAVQLQPCHVQGLACLRYAQITQLCSERRVSIATCSHDSPSVLPPFCHQI